jgi:hypothetical protein
MMNFSPEYVSLSQSDRFIEVVELEVNDRSTVDFWSYVLTTRLGQALEGRTPAEACGIKVEGKNKWITLIQNASLAND